MNYFLKTTQLNGEKAFEVFSPKQVQENTMILIQKFKSIENSNEVFNVYSELIQITSKNQNFMDFISEVDEIEASLNSSLSVCAIEDFMIHLDKSFKSYVNLVLNASTRGHDVVTRTEQMLSQIDSIFILIDGLRHIADQTGLLALNAAIEAARSGQVGKSYSYMAEEVKRLSHQSEHFGQDIKKEMNKAKDAVVNTKQLIDNMVVSDVDVAIEYKASIDQLIGQIQGISRTGLNHLEYSQLITSILVEIHQLTTIVLLKLCLIQSLNLIDQEFKADLANTVKEFKTLFTSVIVVYPDKFM